MSNLLSKINHEISQYDALQSATNCCEVLNQYQASGDRKVVVHLVMIAHDIDGEIF